MHRYKIGKGKKKWNYFLIGLQIFQIPDSKFFEKALLWDHLLDQV